MKNANMRRTWPRSVFVRWLLPLSSLVLGVSLLFVLMPSKQSSAYDSSGGEFGSVTHNIPAPPPPWPFDMNFFNAGNPALPDAFSGPVPYGPQYLLKVLSGSMGAVYGVETPDPMLGMYLCDPIGPQFQVPDLSTCRVVRGYRDATLSNNGWVRTRRRWDVQAPSPNDIDGNRPEHMLIVQAAASLAGFDKIRFFDEDARLWVRYPTKNSLIVSPVNVTPSQLLVGQSFIPVRRVEAQAHAVRGVYLPELAQLPDQAHSAWDWAAGAEICPVGGQDRMAGLLPDPTTTITACHQFSMAMGAVNMTHFLPMSQAVYKHYHDLALQRMNECKALVTLGDGFFEPIFDPNMGDVEYGVQHGYWGRYTAPNNTEAHECEREAFVYEMIALHYMGDAWSTGHMWDRWGYPDLSGFPNTLGPSPYTFKVSKDNVSPPAANHAARQFTIAAVVAALAGTIHGAKAIASATYREQVKQQDAQSPLPPLLDDPLCGPIFYNPWDIGKLDPTDPTSLLQLPPHPVEWRSDTPDTGPDQERWKGAGDLFWDPLAPDKIHIAFDADYAEQRQRLLGCSARSLRQVYEAGPKLEGELPEAGSVEGLSLNDPRLADPGGDYCWNHRVTNASMLGALGPALISRDFLSMLPKVGKDIPVLTPLPVVTSAIVELANVLIFNNRRKLAQFPNEVDKLKFLAALQMRMILDVGAIETLLTDNWRTAANGTHSSHLKSADNPSLPPFNLLNAEPNKGPAPGALPAEFVDRAQPRGPESQFPEDYYISRMFWRSHLRELCADPNVANDLQTLRDRCIAGAAQGGDPEACTNCVETAEVLMPPCKRVSSPTSPGLGSSKCQKLGAGSTQGLPAEWFDYNGRISSLNGVACGYPNYWYAFTWCTGTVENTTEFFADGSIGFPADGQASVVVKYGSVVDNPCDEPDPYLDPDAHQYYQTIRFRTAVAVSELSNNPPLPVAAPGPLITAFEQTITRTVVADGSGCRLISSSDLENVVASSSNPFPLWVDKANDQRALRSHWDQFGLATCGPRQRLFYFNTSCAGFKGLPPAPGVVDPNTGAEFVPGHAEAEDRCSIRSAWEMAPPCPFGQCNAGGICAANSPSPPIEYMTGTE